MRSLSPSTLSAAHAELTRLSKKIASLLSQPLCDVVLRLRELRTSQEVKVSVTVDRE